MASELQAGAVAAAEKDLAVGYVCTFAENYRSYRSNSAHILKFRRHIGRVYTRKTVSRAAS